MAETPVIASVAPLIPEAPVVAVETGSVIPPDVRPAGTVPDAVVSLPPVTSDTARNQLEVITNPVDTQSELGATKDQINALLEQGSQFLLDSKDSRILITALARQAGATPLGIELRRNALIMLRDYPPEQSNMKRHNRLRTAINVVVPSDKKEDSSAFLSFLETEQANFTGTELNKFKAMIDAVRSGNINSYQVISHYLNDPSEPGASIGHRLWQKIGGEQGSPLRLQKPDEILKAADLRASRGNVHRLKETFAKKHPKDMHKIMMGAEIGVLLYMLFSQLITEGEGKPQGQH